MSVVILWAFFSCVEITTVGYKDRLVVLDKCNKNAKNAEKCVGTFALLK